MCVFVIVLVSSTLGLQSRQSPTVLGNIHAFSAQMALTRLSRYFVIKIVDDNGRSAFIGIGFSDRSDSFDLNVALQDHFKGVTKEAEIAKASLLGKIRTKNIFFKNLPRRMWVVSHSWIWPSRRDRLSRWADYTI